MQTMFGCVAKVGGIYKISLDISKLGEITASLLKEGNSWNYS